MDAIVKPLGAEGNLSLDIVGGKLVITASHEHSSGKVSLTVEEDGGYFLDKLKAKIPGTVDDAIFDVLKIALKAL